MVEDVDLARVWFVTTNASFQGDELHGVYTTEEAAAEAAAKLNDADVQDYPLNKRLEPPHWMGC